MSPVLAAPSRSLRLSAFAAAVCLAALACPRLLPAQFPDQTVGSVDTSFNGSGASPYSIYAQYLDTVSNQVPALLVGGDRAGFAILRASDGATTNVLYDFNNTIFGNPSGRVIYTIVPELVTQPDGVTRNLLFGGVFGKSIFQVRDDLPAQNVFRIGPLGGIDTSFNPGKGADDFITSITPLPDGGMLLGGMFSEFNDQEHQHIVRLDNGGAIVPDSVFKSNVNFDLSVLAVATQTVGVGTPAAPQFVVGGIFTSVSGSQHNRLVRLNFDGTIDESFRPAFDERVTAVTTQPDGKILVGGDFINVNGEDRRHIVRLNYDGSIDQGFVASVTTRPNEFDNPAAVYVIKLLDNGAMYLGGNFTIVNGEVRSFLARVDANGVLDTAFDPGKNVINAVQSLNVLEGRLYVGETLSKRPTGEGPYQQSLIRLFTEVATVKLKAPDNNASKTTKDPAVFRLTRRSNEGSTSTTTVFLQLSGSAVLGKNFTFNAPSLRAVPNHPGFYTATFPAGNTSTSQNARVIRIEVVPKGKPNGKPGKTVTLTVVPDPDRIDTAPVFYQTGQTETVGVTD